jgi:S1-C subfamily serine protease
VDGGPAEKAGLRGADDETMFQLQRVRTGGDLIVAIDGKPVVANDDLSELVATHQPGDTVTLEVIRDGDRAEIELTLGARPEDVNR